LCAPQAKKSKDFEVPEHSMMPKRKEKRTEGNKSSQDQVKTTKGASRIRYEAKALTDIPKDGDADTTQPIPVVIRKHK
jgi:hypothetical protein